jgi:hypothetical protein
MEKIIKFNTTKRGSKNYESKQEHTWILDDQLNIDDVLSKPEFSKFKYAATIVESNNTSGYQIQLEPEFMNQSFIVYLVEKHGKVLKGGKSKNPLNNRSYSAGTEESWTMRGTCSETNYVWSQIFRESTKDGHPIKFYAMVVPSITMTYESFDGEMITEMVSPYESEEKKLNGLLNKMNGKKVIGEGKLMVQIKK